MSFKFLNVEPEGLKLQDCVIRAISLFLATPYDNVVNMLAENGLTCDCSEICVDCYKRLLEELGYTTHYVKSLTVNDIMQMHPNGVLLIRIDGHLTCAIDCCIYDLWDCRNRLVDCFWITT